MASPKPPTIQLFLKPHFYAGEATLIDATVIFPHNVINAKSGPILIYDLFYENVPCYVHTERRVRGIDKMGSVPFIFVDVNKYRQDWRPGRDIVGDLKLELQVFPRRVTKDTPIGPRMDIRADGGGLIGAGAYFLPAIAKKGTYEFSVEWDLSLAPPGTRAVWTYGEGPRRQTHIGDQDTLRQTAYMVGPIKSYPAEPSTDSPPGFCATYWLGTLPDNLYAQRCFNTELFEKLSHTLGIPQDTYRVFIRNAATGYGGTSFSQSYVLDYDERARSETASELQRLFTHEMIQTTTISQQTSEETAWFVEGLPAYLSAFLPYRYGLVEEDYVLTEINKTLSKYYSNPKARFSLDEALRAAYTDWYLSVLIYSRGFTYLLLLDFRLRALSETYGVMTQSPLEDIAIEMLTRRRERQPFNMEVWFRALQRWAGERIDYRKEWEYFHAGSLIDLTSAWLFSPHNPIVRRDLPVLVIGIDILPREGAQYISGITRGSQAELSGIERGDRIIGLQRADVCADLPDEPFWAVVDRGGKFKKIQWQPRSATKVPAWTVESFQN